MEATFFLLIGTAALLGVSLAAWLLIWVFCFITNPRQSWRTFRNKD